MPSVFSTAAFAAVVLVAASMSSSVDAATCGTATFGNGTAVNTAAAGANGIAYLSGLTQTDVAPGPYNWAFSICNPAATVQNGGSACGGAGAFLSQDNCGKVFGTMAAAPTSSGDHLTVAYTTSDNWIATCNLYCGTGSLQVIGNTYQASAGTTYPYVFTFNLASSAFCVPGAGPGPGPSPPSGGDGGITWGGVFLIIFFVPLGIYVLGFVAWNYKQGMAGMDLLPHREFWGSLWPLCKDGVTFIWSKIRGTQWESCENGSGGGASGESAGTGTGGYTTV